MTKSKMREIFAQYTRTHYTSIYEVYKNPSVRKQIALCDCVRIADNLNGKDLRIVSANKHNFTAGFVITMSDDILFIYITKNYVYTYSPIKDKMSRQSRGVWG